MLVFGIVINVAFLSFGCWNGFKYVRIWMSQINVNRRMKLVKMKKEFCFWILVMCNLSIQDLCKDGLHVNENSKKVLF